ncbi:MAG: TrmH family RNA methyltransferase [Campylobacterota bacterium]
MKLTPVTQLNTPNLEVYKLLRDNHFTVDNGFVADSPKVVNILLQTDITLRSILATQEYYDRYKELIKSKQVDNLYVASKELMSTIVGHKIHHHVMAHGQRPSQCGLDGLDDKVLMLDYITSAENIGSLARCSAALGVNSFLLPTKAPHPYSRRALRVSMGHISKLRYNIYEDIVDTIHALKDRGYKIFGAEVTPTATPLSQVTPSGKWVLLMGNEGYGLAQEVIELCDEIVTIEMAEGVRSFNVAVAASLILYRFQNG